MDYEIQKEERTPLSVGYRCLRILERENKGHAQPKLYLEMDAYTRTCF